MAIFAAVAEGIEQSGVVGNPELADNVGHIIGLALAGAIFGLLQWAVLRRHFTSTGWGVLGTSIGLAIGYILGYIMGGPPFDFILAPALAMLLGGFAQWLALRRQTTEAGWWVALSTVGFTIGGIVGTVIAIMGLGDALGGSYPAWIALNGVVYLAPLFLFGIMLREEPALLGKPQIRVGVWFVAVGLLLQQAAPLLGGAEVPRSSLAAALCGCGAAYVLFATCPRIALFEKVGAYSYTIYLWHSVAAAAARETLEHFVALPTVVAFTVLMAIGIIVPIAIHLSVRHIPVLATLMAGLRSPSLPSSASSKFAEPRVGVLLARSANDNSAGTSRAPSGQARTR